jgi:hypothetical protein
MNSELPTWMIIVGFILFVPLGLAGIYVIADSALPGIWGDRDPRGEE